VLQGGWELTTFRPLRLTGRTAPFFQDEAMNGRLFLLECRTSGGGKPILEIESHVAGRAERTVDG
jgi:hypothetical protein